MLRFFFFFNDTATTEIYTLSLHDALPILFRDAAELKWRGPTNAFAGWAERLGDARLLRSEEHTSELQSQSNLVCRLLLEKKNNSPNALIFSRQPRNAPPAKPFLILRQS